MKCLVLTIEFVSVIHLPRRCERTYLDETTAADDLSNHVTVNGEQGIRAVEQFGLPHSSDPIANLVLGISNNRLEIIAVLLRGASGFGLLR